LVPENVVVVGGCGGVEDDAVEIGEGSLGGIDEGVDDRFERVLEHLIHFLNRFIDGLFRKGIELTGDDVGSAVDLTVEVVGELQLRKSVVFCAEGNVGELGVHPFDLVLNLGYEEILLLRFHGREALHENVPFERVAEIDDVEELLLGGNEVSFRGGLVRLPVFVEGNAGAGESTMSGIEADVVEEGIGALGPAGGEIEVGDGPGGCTGDGLDLEVDEVGDVDGRGEGDEADRRSACGEWVVKAELGDCREGVGLVRALERDVDRDSELGVIPFDLRFFR
jgi:hypothetical protein